MATVAFGVKVTEPGNVVDEKWFSDPYICEAKQKYRECLGLHIKILKLIMLSGVMVQHVKIVSCGYHKVPI